MQGRGNNVHGNYVWDFCDVYQIDSPYHGDKTFFLLGYLQSVQSLMYDIVFNARDALMVFTNAAGCSSKLSRNSLDISWETYPYTTLVYYMDGETPHKCACRFISHKAELLSLWSLISNIMAPVIRGRNMPLLTSKTWLDWILFRRKIWPHVSSNI